MTPNRKVLVTYAWVRSSLAMIRNLARHGLEIYAGDHQDFFMSKVSRYTTGWVKYPGYQKDPEGFVGTLARFIEEKGIGTYLPSHEEGLVVAKYRDRFPASVKIPLAPYDVLNQLHNKATLPDLTRELGVPHPETFVFSSVEDFARRKDALPLPVIVKQLYSHGSHGVAICRTAAEVEAAWTRFAVGVTSAERLPIVQRYLEGKRIYAASLLAQEGRVVGTFVRRNLREKEPFGGAAVKCESIHFPELTAHATRIAEHVKLTGVAMFEFLVDETTREHWLMEINPRYWGTSSHEIDCGVEFPWMQWCLANHVPFREHPEYQDGLKSRWIVGDVISWLKSRRVATDRWQNLQRYLDFDDDFFMDLKLDDPMPFFVEAYLYFKFRKQVLG